MPKAKTVTLVLSLSDAAALAAVQDHIGGDPKGPRGAFDRIGDALYAAGIRPPNTDKGEYILTAIGAQGLYFGKGWRAGKVK